jgi:hypothetical protein
MCTCVNTLTAMSSALDKLPDDTLSVGTTKAAEMLGMSRRKLMEHIYAGHIQTSRVPSIRSGQPYSHLIEVAELKAFLARYRTAVTA